MIALDFIQKKTDQLRRIADMTRAKRERIKQRVDELAKIDDDLYCLKTVLIDLKPVLGERVRDIARYVAEDTRRVGEVLAALRALQEAYIVYRRENNLLTEVGEMRTHYLQRVFFRQEELRAL